MTHSTQVSAATGDRIQSKWLFILKLEATVPTFSPECCNENRGGKGYRCKQ